MEWIFSLLAVMVLVVANVIATKYIWSAQAYEPEQKRIQTIIVWLVPFVGAVFFSYFLWHDRKEEKHKRKIDNDTSITDQEAVDHTIGADHHGSG